jgi:DNA gyrase subunit A
MGRKSTGVKGITLKSEDNEVIGMVCIKKMEEDILVVSEKGYGKRSKIEDYRVTNRGGKGVKTMKITEKTGKLIAIKSVTDENDLMIINKSGITIRLAVSNMRVMGRATQGVRLINLDRKQDEIASVAKVVAEKEEEKPVNETDTEENIINRVGEGEKELINNEEEMMDEIEEELFEDEEGEEEEEIDDFEEDEETDTAENDDLEE